MTIKGIVHKDCPFRRIYKVYNERAVHVTVFLIFVSMKGKMLHQTWKDKLKTQWDENPIQVLIVGSLVATAAAKLLDALSGVSSRRAYARRMNYPRR